MRRRRWRSRQIERFTFNHSGAEQQLAQMQRGTGARRAKRGHAVHALHFYRGVVMAEEVIEEQRQLAPPRDRAIELVAQLVTSIRRDEQARRAMVVDIAEDLTVRVEIARVRNELWWSAGAVIPPAHIARGG